MLTLEYRLPRNKYRSRRAAVDVPPAGRRSARRGSRRGDRVDCARPCRRAATAPSSASGDPTISSRRATRCRARNINVGHRRLLPRDVDSAAGRPRVRAARMCRASRSPSSSTSSWPSGCGPATVAVGKRHPRRRCPGAKSSSMGVVGNTRPQLLSEPMRDADLWLPSAAAGIFATVIVKTTARR